MALTGDNYEEKPSNGSVDGNPVFNHKEALGAETARQAAERGHAATDKSVPTLHSPDLYTDGCIRYGKSLVHFDPAAEARLRLKIDLYVVPTVALLYLFCFIDRANIGRYRLR